MALLSGTDLLYNIRKYFPLSKQELEAFAIAVVTMTIVVGFNDGHPTFELVPWLTNIVVSALIILLCATVFISAQRVAALWWGYRSELVGFLPGIGIGMMLTLMTFGAYPWLWWMGMHGIKVHMFEAQRLGYFRYFVRLWDVAFIALAGPLALIILAFIFRIFYFLPGGEIAQHAVRICTLYAFYQMLPLPPLAGHNIIFASRWLYFLMLGITICLGIVLVVPWIPIIF